MFPSMIENLMIPLSRLVPLPNGHSWLINGCDPNYLLSGPRNQSSFSQMMINFGAPSSPVHETHISVL